MNASNAAVPEMADVTIVGAGPVGGTLALLLADAGFKTVLIDARDLAKPPARNDTRTFAVVRGSWRMLGLAGITERLEAGVQPLNGLEAVDGGRHWFGAPKVLFGADDLDIDPDGTPLGYMVPAKALQNAIDARLKANTNLTWLTPARFEGLKAHSGMTEVHLADGRVVETQVVAACDGVNSSVRTALDIAVEGRAYGKSVFAADVKLARDHGGIARQLFTPQGPFATLPLPNQRANLAWYMAEGAAETLAQMPTADIEAELNAQFAAFAGEMILDGPPLAYPLHLKLATQMVAARAALLGDAARRINPLAGQGLNLGFKDVAALVEVLVDARGVGLDIGAAVTLERYQEWRRFDANTTAMFMDGIDRVFSNDSAVLKPLRGMALTLAGSIPPLRRGFARRASADQAGLPKLLQGQRP